MQSPYHVIEGDAAFSSLNFLQLAQQTISDTLSQS
jgi:hypothetical protein